MTTPKAHWNAMLAKTKSGSPPSGDALAAAFVALPAGTHARELPRLIKKGATLAMIHNARDQLHDLIAAGMIDVTDAENLVGSLA